MADSGRHESKKVKKCKEGGKHLATGRISGVAPARWGRDALGTRHSKGMDRAWTGCGEGMEGWGSATVPCSVPGKNEVSPACYICTRVPSIQNFAKKIASSAMFEQFEVRGM
uniref:Uncharacterized protein n=1 Tax=Sphaerodactylus townsendi TaxID=933632 RepID=A0ACB8FKE7_9SAUR